VSALDVRLNVQSTSIVWLLFGTTLAFDTRARWINSSCKRRASINIAPTRASGRIRATCYMATPGIGPDDVVAANRS